MNQYVTVYVYTIFYQTDSKRSDSKFIYNEESCLGRVVESAEDKDIVSVEVEGTSIKLSNSHDWGNYDRLKSITGDDDDFFAPDDDGSICFELASLCPNKKEAFYETVIQMLLSRIVVNDKDVKKREERLEKEEEYYRACSYAFRIMKKKGFLETISVTKGPKGDQWLNMDGFGYQRNKLQDWEAEEVEKALNEDGEDY